MMAARLDLGGGVASVASNGRRDQLGEFRIAARRRRFGRFAEKEVGGASAIALDQDFVSLDCSGAEQK
jgi:hypothetical protein